MLFTLSIFTSVVINTFLGIAIFIRNPKAHSNRYFGLLTLSLIGWAITLYLYYAISDPSAVLLLGRLNFFVATYISFFFFCLAYYFPRRILKWPKLVTYTITTITVVVSIISYITPLIDQNELIKGDQRELVPGPLYAVWILLILLNMILGIYVIIRKLKLLPPHEKAQIQLLLLGFVGTFLVGLFTNVILPMFSIIELQSFGPLCTIILVAATSYAISKHKLFDIRALTVRAVTYFIMLSLIGLLYTGVLFIVSSNFISRSDPLFFPVATILTLFVGFTFSPLQNIVSQMTNKLFYKRDYNLNEVILRLSQKMTSTLEEEIFVKELLTELQQVLTSTLLAVYIYKNENITEIVTLKEEHNLLVEIPKDDLIRLQSEEQILEVDEIEDIHAIKGVMQKYDMHVYVPLFIERRFIGSLMLGPKASGEIYYDKDIKMLHTFCSEFALALNNAHNYDEIKRFNITLQEEVKRATEKLRQANEHLKELDKMKDEFLSVASHDLRTPMTAIKGYLWLMLKKLNTFPEDSGEKLRRIYNSTERMIALINDMLDISRIEGGRIEIVHEEFNIVDTAKEVEQELLGQTEERHQQFIIENGTYMVRADRNRTHEVLVNLIGNAIKFTPNGGSIHVTFRERGGSVVTSVTDSGIGIAKEDIQKLFKKFGRIDNSDKMPTHVPGTGLGLYICKKIIELSGGEISVTSEKDKGSSFIFSLPKV